MRSLALAAVTGSFVVAAPAVAHADPYIAIGDSYTPGFAPAVYGHYQATLGATQLNSKASPGASSTQALSSQVPSAVADINSASDTKAVTVFIGGADAVFGPCGTSRDEPGCPLRPNMDAIFAALQSALTSDPGDEPLIAGVYPNPREGEGTMAETNLDQMLIGTDFTFDLTDTTGPEVGINEVIHQEAIEDGIPVADPYDEFVACGSACVQGDGLHPNSAGYAIIAELFCGGPCQSPGGGGGGGEGPDTSPPDTTITDGPEGKTKKKSATFTFSGSDARAVASFQCKLDDGPFEACTSPKTYSKLKKGKHTVEVRAVDSAGNVDPTPATRSWKVKRKKK